MIKSQDELTKIIEEIKSKTPKENLLLFRWQINHYDKIHSGKSRPHAFVNTEVENGWNTIVNRITGHSEKNVKYNQSILQHYGFQTYFLDLTSNFITAAWFACNKYTKMPPCLWIGNTLKLHDEVTYKEVNEWIWYLYILEIPNHKKMIKDNELFDISNESIFSRPIKQDAFLILDNPNEKIDPNNFIKKILKIDRSIFKSEKKAEDLFPHPNKDIGYEKLLNVPFIQMPSYYLNHDEGKVDNEKSDRLKSLEKHALFWKRAISIPFYTSNKNDLFDYNPKWKDTTIYEPSAFRLWKTDSDFNLSDIHKWENSLFKESLKITISPIAYNEIIENDEKINIQWPDINSNSIFYTKADNDHDKVILHDSPYLWVWLYKNKNKIIETHLTVEDENENMMNINYGHVYVLNNGKLEYAKSENECPYGQSKEHLKYIESLLKIHWLILMKKIALIQHPFFVSNWYILL